MSREDGSKLQGLDKGDSGICPTLGGTDGALHACTVCAYFVLNLAIENCTYTFIRCLRF